MKYLKFTLIVSLLSAWLVACHRSDRTKQDNEATEVVEEVQAVETDVSSPPELTATELEQQALQKRLQEETERLKAEEQAKAKAQKLAQQKQAQQEAQKLAALKKAEAKKLAAEKQANENRPNNKVHDQAAKEKLAAQEKAKAEAQRKLAAQEKAKADAKAKVLAQQQAQEQKRLAEEEQKALAAKQQAQDEANEVATPETTSAPTSFTKYDFAQNTGAKTPVGAQESGNADGTIPAWTGGITKPPAVYKKGDHHQDPFARDEVLFTINSSNYKQYAEQLSVGQKAMFEKYPDTWKMNVYKSRRSASFPKRIYQKTIENGRTGKLAPEGEGVENVAEGFPFPNPKNAYELMWNHKLKYKGFGGVRYNNQVAPTATGRYTVVKLREEILGKYYIPGNTIEDTDNILFYFYQVVESPARLAGRILLVHETINQIVNPRQAWIYNPGQRRVRRAPNVAYDNPGTASDGLRTNDMTDMFNGAMDRFNWVTVAKKEMYIPYNSYKVHSGNLDYSDIVRAGHLNQDLMRYELHRVWVVEATLKQGMRHINSRRTFYLDEDSYQIVLVDHYDKRGNIWRFSEAHSINYYDVPTFWSTVEVHHDLRSGRYVAVGLDNKEPVNTFNVPLSESNYTPQALRKRGTR